MNTVWLLIEQMDYESKEIHSIYAEKPRQLDIIHLLKDSYGYAYEYGVMKDLATKLCRDNSVRFLEMYTWTLEERAVIDYRSSPNENT